MEYNRFVWSEENPVTIIKNDSIQCADCKYRTDPDVLECDIYSQKPKYVLEQRKPCPDYQVRED